MPSLDANKKMWNETYSWPLHGEEWGASESPWGQLLQKHFLLPFLRPDYTVLEIGPGHGRWSEILARKSGKLILVDLSENCIAFCKEKLKRYSHVDYFVNNGAALEFVRNQDIDLICSIDAFVHMEADIYEAYFAEFFRILKPGGKAVIHHPGKNPLFLNSGFLTRYGKAGNYLYQRLTTGTVSRELGDGWRANISGRQVRKIAGKHGLRIEKQTRCFEKNQKISVYNDCVSVLSKER